MSSEKAFPASRAVLEAQLENVLIKDREPLIKTWLVAEQRLKKRQPVDRLVQKFVEQRDASCDRIQCKLDRLPEITFPDALPISEKRSDIAALIDLHQVVIIAGETGSGKTTQIPKICLSLGRGIRGLIGHTQPRRIAASTVASRIAEELNTEIGSSVGYQVRFTDKTNPDSCIKLMTDGILLAEIQSDPLLLNYDTLIIDEAHERSLNIDFLLGYIKNILPKRPDLKVIVTSATIDLERFSKHFNDAPVLEVSGRTFPVDIVYRPSFDEEEQAQAIINAIEEILTLPNSQNGDILVFLSGERDIRETAHAIRKANFPHLEVLPLYARLSLSEQNKVFQKHRGRRVVLATNVAETSITVPGIGYVIDPGFARISRYSARTKVQRLPIEAISQASANQRAGRCGRVSNGVCFRLYEKEDFESRPEFTDAEILRTNLASVILQMLQMGIGNIQKFPFVDAPDHRLIRDGYKLLEELQAVNSEGQLTPLGKQMAALPIDPRLARMIIEANKQACLQEVLIIAAAMTVQDPRERPAEKQQASDEKHRRFWDDDSDFVAYLKLWQYAEEQRQELSQNQWRKQCAKEFLSFMRLREWRELHHQMRLAIRSLGFKENAASSNYESIHRALLAGLLSHIGLKSDESKEWDYLGARNRKFSIFPGSSQFKKRPKWIVAGEMLETTKLYGHGVARIEPEWVLDLAQHLIKHHYHEPHYNKKSGQVMGYDRQTLYGLVLTEKKRINYGQVDAKLAREVFIRSALVEGKYADHPKNRSGDFFKHNQQQIETVQKLEAKSRRQDILVDDEWIFQFYNERVAEHVVNLRGFEHWRKETEKQQGDLLKIPLELLMQHSAEEITEAQFPEQMEIDGLELPLFYHFEPGHVDDGVSIGIPASVLHTIPEHRLDYLVPGFLKEKCVAIIKSLPKQWRKKFVPVPHYVDQILPRIKASHEPLFKQLQKQLEIISGTTLPDKAFDECVLDDYYRMNIHVLDDKRRLLDRGRDLQQLRERYRGHVQSGLQEAGSELERENITEWDFGALEHSCTLKKGGINVRAFPALVKEKQSIALRLLDNPLDAEFESRKGLVALLAERFPQQVKYLQKSLIKNKDIGLTVVKMGTRQEVVQDLINAAIYHSCLEGKETPRTEQDFQDIAEGGSKIVEVALELEALLLDVLSQVVQIKKSMKTNKNALALAFTIGDINSQIDQLLYSGALFDTPFEWLQQFPRYFKGITMRLEKAPQNIQKDKLQLAVVTGFWQAHSDRLEKEGKASFNKNDLWLQFRWLLEELRVSLFAQTLKTRVPVSEKRLKKLWDESLAKPS